MQILFLSSRSSRPHVNALFLVQHYWWHAGLSLVGGGGRTAGSRRTMRRGGRCSRRRGRSPGGAREGGAGGPRVAGASHWGGGVRRGGSRFSALLPFPLLPPPSLPVASVRAGEPVGGRVGGGPRAVGSSPNSGSTCVPAQPSLHGWAGWPQRGAGPRPPPLFLTRERVPLTRVWFGGDGGQRRWGKRRALWPSGDARRPTRGEGEDGGRWGRPAAAGRVPAGASAVASGLGAMVRGTRAQRRLWWRHRPRPRLPVAPFCGRQRPGRSDFGLPAGRAAAAQWPRRHAPARAGACLVLFLVGALPGGVVWPPRQRRPAASSLASPIVGVAALLQGGAAG